MRSEAGGFFFKLGGFDHSGRVRWSFFGFDGGADRRGADEASCR